MATQDRETTVQIPMAKKTWRISMATQNRETTVQIPTIKYNMADFNGYPEQGNNCPNTNSQLTLCRFQWLPRTGRQPSKNQKQ